MKAFLKRWGVWLLLGAVVIAAVIVYQKWPRLKTKITFTDLPIIVGDAITGGGEDETDRERDELDGLINGALADYDHG